MTAQDDGKRLRSPRADLRSFNFALKAGIGVIG
jgi:hypothetical protein